MSMSVQDTVAASNRLAMLRQAIQERRTREARSDPNPASSIPCRFFTRGLCQRSTSCPFDHSQRWSNGTKSLKTAAVKRSKRVHRSLSSPENRLMLLNDLLSSHRQQRNKRAALSSTATVPLNRFQAATKSMSWVRAGFTPQPSSKPAPTSKPKSLIINGIRFRLSNCGRSLVRCQSVLESSTIHLPQKVIPSRVQLNGVDFIKTSAGTLVRSSVQATRRTASQRLKRSLQLVRNKKLDKRKQQLCMFFCRFGFCKLDKRCPFIHDTSKVAICRSFVLVGVCASPETCLLSHTLDRNKMPECSHFLKGICAKGDFCPYRHVKVSEDAAFCQDFITGYCSKGEQCKLRHAYSSRKEKTGSAKVDAEKSTGSDKHNI